MARRKCKSCKCKCLLLSLNCFVQSSIVDLDLGADTIIYEMDKAQRLYISPIIGETCLDNLCTALDNADLPDTDPNYVALSTENETLVNKLEPFLVAAVEYSYFEKYGYSKLTGSGAKYNENWLDTYYKSQRRTLEQMMNIEQSLFETWLVANCAAYDCYECEDTSTYCETDNDNIVLGWGTTSPYSSF